MMVKALQVVFGALAVLPAVLAEDGGSNWISPEYKWLFEKDLFIPPVATPTFPTGTFVHNVTGKPINYYEIEIEQFPAQVYPAELGFQPALLWGYNGISPGPTFIHDRGTEAFVRFRNKIAVATSVHLHGSYSRTPWDGWAEDITLPGQFKDYYYPNNQSARMLWYHDHAIDHTAENAYHGLAGAYIIHDKDEHLPIPTGYGTRDIPLVLASKIYNPDGTLWSPEAHHEETSVWGDIIHVNGVPWPKMDVQGLMYRFRFLNAAVSRSFLLYFEEVGKEGVKLPFQAIGSDAGLLESPQTVTSLYISMAERYEIVFDFKNFRGKKITLRNTRGFAADVDYMHTDKVMQFHVANQAVAETFSMPSSLRAIPRPQPKTNVDHTFKFERKNSQWTINGVTFADVANRIMAKPARGAVEVWQLENSSGGWSHPIHVHLVDFEVFERVDGRGVVMPYERTGLKDVVWLGPNEKVKVRAYYQPWEGAYMFHCHNLIHEDHAMMAAFDVQLLADFGYSEPTHFADPMEPRFRAVPSSTENYVEQAIRDKINLYSGMQPYNLVEEVEHHLAEYWGRLPPAPDPTTTSDPTPTPTPTLGNSGKGKGGGSGGSGGSGGNNSKGKKVPRRDSFYERLL